MEVKRDYDKIMKYIINFHLNLLYAHLTNAVYTFFINIEYLFQFTQNT